MPRFVRSFLTFHATNARASMTEGEQVEANQTTYYSSHISDDPALPATAHAHVNAARGKTQDRDRKGASKMWTRMRAAVATLAVLFLATTTPNANAGEFRVIDKDDPLAGKPVQTLIHYDEYKGICTGSEYSINDAIPWLKLISVSISTFDCASHEGVPFNLSPETETRSTSCRLGVGAPPCVPQSYESMTGNFVAVATYIEDDKMEKRTTKLLSTKYANEVTYTCQLKECPQKRLRMLVDLQDGRQSFVDYDFTDPLFRKFLASASKP